MKIKIISTWVLLLILQISHSVFSQPSQTQNPILTNSAQPLAQNPEVEKQMNRLAEELRCLVCQNESLAESRAGLADDLRRELREQIKIGKTDDEIKDFMVERYGEFVLYRPRFKTATWLLWLGPVIFVILGVVLLIGYIKSRNREIIAKTKSSETTSVNTLQEFNKKRQNLAKLLED